MFNFQHDKYTIDKFKISLGSFLQTEYEKLNLSYGYFSKFYKFKGINRNTIKVIWEWNIKGDNIGNFMSDGGLIINQKLQNNKKIKN